jgi:serine/threonine protein kinase
MEHVQGVSLDQLLLRFKDGLPAAIALEITRQTCLALHVAYAEALGDDGRPMRVIHRDIKPSNILLSIHGEVKVVDFGIAKGEFEGREAKTESVVMGSRPYMAPERLDGIADNPSVDVYSAGMTLFELLTGRTMSLSINPVNHDQAMNRQLGYIQIQGMGQPALEDMRNLIRRMCAYTRDYRPTAVECARDIEQLLYSIDTRYRIGLEEFARTTVLPIYESRPRITPEDALGDSEDDEFLRDITGALTSPDLARSNQVKYAPYLFLFFLAFMVVLLMTLATVKFISERSPSGIADGTVRVKVWIPSDAQAQVGPAFIGTAGGVRVAPGPTVMVIKFDDGRNVKCEFEAVQGLTVRYVWDAGRHGLSIDDGPAVPCEG